MKWRRFIPHTFLFFAGLGSAVWSFVRLPFPLLGENPLLDLVDYHTPNFYGWVMLWYYASPFVAAVLAGLIFLSVWKVWLEGRGRDFAPFGGLPTWPLSPRQKAPANCDRGGRGAAALHNLGEEAITVSCRLMSGGRVLEAVEIDLEANGQEARYIEELFTATDTSDFVGSVRCTAPGRFTGIAVELDAGNRIFTTLPVVPVARAGGGGQETVLYFAHFANGSGTTSDLVFVNVSPRPSGPGPTPYHAAVSPSRPALYFYDQEGHLMDPASVVDLTGDLEVTGDGALSIQTEMEPLGELTISTHGRGELVCGSVTVVSEGPIGGVLRYALPGIGVTGVGASQPVRDALFPARRQADGISTAAAIHNLGEEAMGVSCRLMQGGIVLEEVEIYLEANGQEARYIEEVFPGTDTSDFLGSVRCTASAEGEGMFTGVAVELDAGNQIFTTLPVVPVPERMSQE